MQRRFVKKASTDRGARGGAFTPCRTREAPSARRSAPADPSPGGRTHRAVTWSGCICSIRTSSRTSCASRRERWPRALPTSRGQRAHERHRGVRTALRRCQARQHETDASSRNGAGSAHHQTSGVRYRARMPRSASHSRRHAASPTWLSGNGRRRAPRPQPQEPRLRGREPLDPW